MRRRNAQAVAITHVKSTRATPDFVWHDRKIVAHRVQLVGRANCASIDEPRISESASADRDVQHSELSLGAGWYDGYPERFPALDRFAERSASKCADSTGGRGDDRCRAANGRISSAPGPGGHFHSLDCQGDFDGSARGQPGHSQPGSAPDGEGQQAGDRTNGFRRIGDNTAAQCAERSA
jgi:hypothetical protein